MWRVTVCLFDWTGKLLGTFVPYTTNDATIQVRQMEASRDPKKALKIAKQIVSVKFERMREAAREWDREEYYEEIRSRHPLEKVRSVSEARAAESIVTEAYWTVFRDELKKRWPDARFKVRGHPSHGYKMKAVEPVNAALNYAYSILEAKARTNIARVGLSPHFGFLHSTLPGKEPLVYDLQEYERTAMDRTVLEAVSDREVQEEGFLRTADWTSRLTRSASRKVIEAVTSGFNRKARNGSVDGRFYREVVNVRTQVLMR
jgi:CRISPR-associated protein Cas1